MTCPYCGQMHTTLACPLQGTMPIDYTKFKKLDDNYAMFNPDIVSKFGTSPFYYSFENHKLNTFSQHKQNEYSKENLEKWK